MIIIPIFINYRGCPHRCLYCNEEITAPRDYSEVTEDTVNNIITNFAKRNTNLRTNEQIVQVAFYGGNFTGLPHSEQKRLIDLIKPHIEEGTVDSIRISTRPDYINPEDIQRLLQWPVRTVEIGAQSLDNDVLSMTKRGHTADDVIKAIDLLKKAGFETGIHLMVGLPGDNEDKFFQTVNKVTALKPHLVRLHPTLVLQGTELEKMFIKGEYVPLSLEQAIVLCGEAMRKLRAAGIKIIRVGLHVSQEMLVTGSVLAGPVHPAFGTLVESYTYLKMVEELLETLDGKDIQGNVITFTVPEEEISSFRGYRNTNLESITKRYRPSRINIISGQSLSFHLEKSHV
ncbi:MAG: radical SAM protein [Syntrophales bacterium]|nr:radical SAM protein [Syntrophales bacterium]